MQLNNMLDLMNLDSSSSIDRKNITDALARLQEQGLLKYKVTGINENGEEILEIEMSDAMKEVANEIDFDSLENENVTRN